MAVEKSMASSSLVEVVDRILDKGIVIDAWVRVSLVDNLHQARGRHCPEFHRLRYEGVRTLGISRASFTS